MRERTQQVFLGLTRLGWRVPVLTCTLADFMMQVAFVSRAHDFLDSQVPMYSQVNDDELILRRRGRWAVMWVAP